MSQKTKGWVGFDLDGTLAHYDGWKGPDHIGEPIKPMVSLAKTLIAFGEDVRIFTARASDDIYPNQYAANIVAINKWCLSVFGQFLPITCQKDQAMKTLYDDRCIQVLPNKGISIGGAVQGLLNEIEDAEDNNLSFPTSVVKIKLRTILGL